MSKKKVIRIANSLFGEDRKVWTYVEALDADFLMEPFTRQVRERLLAAGVPVDALAVEGSIDLVAKGLEILIHGWRDSEADEHPLRTADGAVVPFSKENLIRLLEVNEVAGALVEASRALAVQVEFLELGN